jgi:hypothetical protein
VNSDDTAILLKDLKHKIISKGMAINILKNEKQTDLS